MGKQVVGQPRYLKEVNLNIIDRLITEKGPLTKPQIADLTGLSLPTVNKIVDLLEQENKIRSIGMTGSGVGRRAQLYQTNEDSGNVLTVYISQGIATCCVVNMVGDVIYRFSVNLDDAEDSLAVLEEAIQRMMQNCVSKPVAVGVGLPGVVDEEGLVSAIPSLPQWEGLNLQQEIAQRFHIPVYVENNARLTAIGFYNTQLKPTYRDVVYLHIAHGISSGVILDARLHKGFTSFAGELGYMRLTNARSPEDNESMEDVLSRLVTTYRNEVDPEKSVAIRREICRYLSVIVVNYICVVNPEVVVLRGAAVTSDMLEELREQVSSLVPARCVPKFILDSSEFSGIKGIVAACRQFLSPSLDLVKGGNL